MEYLVRINLTSSAKNIALSTETLEPCSHYSSNLIIEL